MGTHPGSTNGSRQVGHGREPELWGQAWAEILDSLTPNQGVSGQACPIPELQACAL